MAGLDIEAFSVDARKEGEVQDLFFEWNRRQARSRFVCLTRDRMF